MEELSGVSYPEPASSLAFLPVKESGVSSVGEHYHISGDHHLGSGCYVQCTDSFRLIFTSAFKAFSKDGKF